MLVCRLFRIGNDRDSFQNSLQIALPCDLMRAHCPLYPVPEFGHRDGGNLKLLTRTGRHPLLEVEGALLTLNDDVRIQNYRHLSAGSLRVLRAACKSRCHALASFSGKSVSARASAKSRPTQTFSSPGVRRATGSPFLRSTNVTF